VEADVIRTYVDGVLKGSKTDGTGNIAQTENLVIGNTNVNFVNAFGGSIDEVSIYKGALTAEEVLENYNKGLQSGFGNSNYMHQAATFPMPFSNSLTIKSPALTAEKAMVTIRTVAGQLVYQSDISVYSGEIQLKNLSAIKSGVYFCSIQCGDNEFTLKVMK
jgi:hypothetical protein